MLLQLGKETQAEKVGLQPWATAAGGDIHPKDTLLDAARNNFKLAAQKWSQAEPPACSKAAPRCHNGET